MKIEFFMFSILSLIVLIFLVYIYIHIYCTYEMFEESEQSYKDSVKQGEITFNATDSTDIAVEDPNNKTFDNWSLELGALEKYIPPELSFLNGSTIEKAAPNAKFILDMYNGLKTTNPNIILPKPKNGYYWINLNVVGPKYIYCIMEESFYGGGWMLAMRAVSNSKTFRYRSEHWTNNTTLKSSDEDIKTTLRYKVGDYDSSDFYTSSIGTSIYSDAANIYDAKFDTFNYFPAREWMSIFYNKNISTQTPITGGDLPENIRGWVWNESDINYNGKVCTPLEIYQNLDKSVRGGRFNKNINLIKNNEDPRNLNKFKNNGKKKIWSSQSGAKWYGINFDYNSWWDWRGSSVRWGFTWNNEGDFESNDVHGGIGVDYDTAQGGHRNSNNGYSCGDFIWCCQSDTGLNKTMPFEWFVR